MNTYTDRKKAKRHYVLLKDCEVIATFGSLKKICNYMGDAFPSYWTLVRREEFPIIVDDYKIFKVKHH